MMFSNRAAPGRPLLRIIKPLRYIRLYRHHLSNVSKVAPREAERYPAADYEYGYIKAWVSKQSRRGGSRRIHSGASGRQGCRTAR